MINYISDNITEAKITSVTTGDVCYNPSLGNLMVFDGNSWAYTSTTGTISIEHKHSYE